MKRLLSVLVSIVLLLSLVTPSFSENSSVSESSNNLGMKEKYIRYLAENPEMEERQIIVKFKNADSENNIGTLRNISTENVSFGNISYGNTSAGSISNGNMVTATIEKLNLSTRCEVVKTIENSNVSVLQAKTDNVSELLETLNNDENVLYAQPDYKVVATENALESKQWAVQNYGQTVDRSTGESGFDINLIDAWDITRGTEEVVVGVIDTGIDISHLDLANNIWTNTKETVNGVDDDNNGYVDDIHGWDFVSEDNSVYDMDALDEHGTHMAGIIAANGKVSGVAPEIKVMPLKALNYSSGYTSDIIEAINYAKINGVKIINCSFASIQYNPALEEAIASNPDILFVCAAGNYGKPTTEIATFPACYDLENIITVSAANNKGQLSEISTYGKYVDVCAPGIGIYSTLPENQYGFKDGTSCSAAFVSGTAALLLSENNDLNSVKLKNKIINSCGNSLPKKTDDYDSETEGIINVASAFSASEIIGKMDDMNYVADLSENSLFRKYPFEIVSEDDNIKIKFDSTKEFASFNLKLYQSTDANVHPYLINSDIPTNMDYIITGMIANNDYNFAIKLTSNDETIEYSGILRYIDNNGLKYIDFDMLEEQKYDDSAYFPYSDAVYMTAAEKNVLVETLSAGQTSEVENNNTISQADTTYDDYDAVGYIHNAADVDYFKVKFNTTGVANFWLGNIPANTDYDLYLYDVQGNLLAQSTKMGTEAELISYYPVQRNKYYYMKIKSSSGYSTSSPYLLRTKWYETPSDYEPNDTIFSAYTLPGYAYNTVNEKITSASDVDYFKVSVPDDSIFEIGFSRPKDSFKFEVYRLHNNSVQLVVSPSGTAYVSELQEGGVYYIKIYSTSGYSSTAYTLTIKSNPLYDISSSAYRSGIMAATQNVYYKLNLSTPLGICAELSNFGNSDYDLYMYDTTFSMITSSANETATETIQAVLQPGSYYIRVKRYSGDNTEFVLQTSVVVPNNDAYLTTASEYPTEMNVNEVKAVTVQATNEGANTWTSAQGYKLAALNQSSNFVSGDRTLSSSESIGYGQSKSFTFNITAPNVDTVTTYTMGWQMKQNSIAFGNKITKTVTVKPNYEELTLGSFKNVSGKATSQMYMFTVDNSGYYAVRTFYYSKDTDTILTLYNSSMTELAYNDDIYSGNRYSRIEAYLTPGTYYVSLSEYSEDAIYCQLAVEQFNIKTISTGGTANITNEYEGYYKFTVSSSGTYIIGTKYYSQNSDTFLVLYDGEIAEDSDVITYNDNDSSNYSRIVVDLNAGTYYVRATTYDYLKEGVRKKVYCKLSLTKQSSTPSVDYTADIDITYPSNNSIVRLYDGASLKISGTASNVSNVVVKVNGSAVSGVKKSGNRFECNYTPNESGDYTIVATGSASYGGSNPSDSVNITLLVNDDGDTFDTATSVKVGTERTSAIDYEEDIDCFTLVPGRSDMYSIYTTGSTDTVISVYNSLYALNAYNDDDNTQTANLNADVPLYLEQNQLYYIMIHSAVQNGTGIYNLCINRLSDDNVSSKILNYGSELKGRIDYPNDEDIFVFYPIESGIYTFRTLGTSDVMGVVYDSEGNFMAFNDDKSETDRNCEIAIALDTGGPYYFAVKHDFGYMYRQNYRVTVE